MPQLSAMELLDLQDKLDELMGKQAGVSGLDLMDLIDEIDGVMAQLGYDASAAEAKPVDQPKQKPDPQPELPPEQVVPEVVTQFLNGDFNGVPSWTFINRLEDLRQYVPTFITVQQVIDISEQWWDQTGQAEADEAAA